MYDAYADRAGGLHGIALRTGVTFADALAVAERQIVFFDRNYHGDYQATSASDFNQAQLLIQLAHGAWDRSLISVELAEVIQHALRDRPLILTRNPWAGGQGPAVVAASKGVLTKLWSRASAQLAETMDSDGAHLSAEIFAEVFQEGILDWAGAGGAAATRKCAMDGRWYTPKVRNRGRFCSDDCRKRFNGLRTLSDESARSFECGGCSERRDLDVFSGLRVAGQDDDQAVRMTQWTRNATDFLCAGCVISSFATWAPYVQSFGTGSERS